MSFENRRRVLIIFAMILALSAMFSYAGSKRNDNYEGIIRFHVKANSNSEEDQALKLKVRDAVLEEINKMLAYETMAEMTAADFEKEKESASQDDSETSAGNTENTVTAKLSLSETREFLTENLEEIEAIAESVIAEEGYSYEADAVLDVTKIPKKKYGDVVFPAGFYEALTINIGEAKGDNWWCVLFPPLCIIDPKGETLEGIEFEEPGIVLKFKTFEIIDELTGK